MSNNQDWYDEIEDDFEEVDFEDFSEKPTRRASGDDVVKKLRRAERAQQKRIKELESELTTVRKSQRDSTIKSVLESKGISSKVAAFVPQDIALSEDAITSWIEDYADVFGVSASSASPVVDERNLATLRQIDAVTAGALAPNLEEDMYLRLNQAESADDILNLIYGAE